MRAIRPWALPGSRGTVEGTAHHAKEAVMQCPVDGTTLALAERAGVEIDYCPQCR
jgi:hypothetical protein